MEWSSNISSEMLSSDICMMNQNLEISKKNCMQLKFGILIEYKVISYISSQL